MLDREMRQKLLEVTELPTLPTVMVRILEVVEDDNSSASDLTAIFEMDHAISARVLRLANSAFYGLRHRVDNIRQAVVVIGFDAVKLLALATSVLDVFAHRKQQALDPEEFWTHSLGAAKAAQLVSDRKKTSSAAACFTMGLLHDVGKYVLDLAFEEQYDEVLRTAQDSQRPLIDVEQEAFGTTHAEVGAWLVEHWQLPEIVATVIRHLYDADYEGPHCEERRIVALSDHLSQLAGFGAAGSLVDETVEPALVRALNFDQAEIDDLAGQLGRYHEATMRFFDALSGN